MSRYEALGILDEATQEPVLPGGCLAEGPKDESPVGIDNGRGTWEPRRGCGPASPCPAPVRSCGTARGTPAEPQRAASGLIVKGHDSLLSGVRAGEHMAEARERVTTRNSRPARVGCPRIGLVRRFGAGRASLPTPFNGSWPAAADTATSHKPTSRPVALLSPLGVSLLPRPADGLLLGRRD
jgi:hypothetical protein